MQEQKSSLFSAFYILFLDSFGFGILFPLFPILLLNPAYEILPQMTTEVGRHLFLGLALAAFPFAQFFGAPFFGQLSDQVGRKKTLYWTLIGTVIGYMLTALAISFRVYWLLMIGRLVTGFFAGNLILCMSIISDLKSDKKKRVKALSLVAAFLGLSWVFAIILGAFFLNTIPISTPFWVVSILIVSSIFVLKYLYCETLPLEKNQKSSSLFKGMNRIFHLLENKQLRVLCLILFFWFFGLTISLHWIAPLSVEKFLATKLQVKWFMVALGGGWVIASGILNRGLIEHSSLWKISLWSLFLTSLFFFFSGVSDYFFYFAASYVIAGIFSAISWGNMMSLISLSLSGEDQGKGFALGQVMLTVAQLLGPLFGGVITGYSIEPVLFACAFMVFIGFLLLLIHVVRRKRSFLYNINGQK